MMQVETDSMILFWQADSVFSNWYQPARFYMRGHLFDNSEAAFMWCKAKCFRDENIANEILYGNQDPREMKFLGREIQNFNLGTWIRYREFAMKESCFEKFSQNYDLKQKLLETGSKTLVEASPYDFVWGIGLAPDNPKALDMKNWKGLNLLGKALMIVRDSLRMLNYD